MAFFSSKKKKDKATKADIKETKPVKVKSVSKTTIPVKLEVVKNTLSIFSSVLIQPRITEKATIQSEKGVYVFEVNKNSTKKEIGSAIKHYYNVTPIKINIIKIPEKKISSKIRGRKGIKRGGKKAYVYLKKGDKIEII